MHASYKNPVSELQTWGPVEYKYVSGTLAVTSFLVHFPLFSSALLWCLQCFDAVGWVAGRASDL